MMLGEWLTEAVAKGYGRAWVDYPPVHAYLRYGSRYLDGNRVIALDVANVSDLPEEQRRKGNFRAFMREIEKRMSGDYIYVENITDKRLSDLLLKNGYTIDRSREHDLCMYRVAP